MSTGMSQTRRRAWLALGIWVVAGAGFALTFFGWGGPDGYAGDAWRIVGGAVSIAAGYGAYLVALWATRGRGGVVVDERDAAAAGQASRATLMIVLVAVFALSVGLWEGYREEGLVPVGWLWFLAYGVVIVTFLVHAIATLLVDARLGGDGG